MKGAESAGFEMIEDSNCLETTADSERDIDENAKSSGRKHDLEMGIPAQEIPVQSDVHQTD